MVTIEVSADSASDVVEVMQGLFRAPNSSVVNLSVDDLSEESVEEAVRKVFGDGDCRQG